MSPYESAYWQECANDLDLENERLRERIRQLEAALADALDMIDDLRATQPDPGPYPPVVPVRPAP